MIFALKDFFPRFILNDESGYAVACGITAGFQYLADCAKRGTDIILDVEKMPEWRLDEMADELGCLYDYTADVEKKRAWIRDAAPLFAAHGTPKAIYNYLEGFFDGVEVEENWQYGAEPYHFRVTVDGAWNEQNSTWAARAIQAAKNVRSVLDGLAVGSGTTIIVRGEGAELVRFGPPLTSGSLYAGTVPTENTIGKVSEVFVIAAPDAQAHTYPYPQAGTRPEENTVGAASDSRITAHPAADGHTYPYPTASENEKTGTRPQENTVGAQGETSAPATTDGKATAFSYSPCTADDPCGGDVI